jgi:hypothetical protein
MPNVYQVRCVWQAESAAGARPVVVAGDQHVWTAAVEEPLGTVER